MAYSYKGSISFGLVYIPITLHSTIKNNDISFNMIDKKSMSRIKYKKTCTDCNNREVKNDDIVKGFEYEEGKFVIFDDQDFEKIKTKKDKNINIECFVDISEIDPLYFDRPFYVVPTGADHAFKILLRAMELEHKVAIAKTVLGTKETLIAIRAKDGEMLLNTLFFFEEVQENPAKDDEKIDWTKADKELKMAKSIISAMTEKFEPEKYHDEYRERLVKAIEQKINGKQIVRPREKSQAKITNLFDALKQSLETLPKTKKTAKTNSANQTKQTKTPKRKKNI